MTEREKYNAILKEVREVHEQGRPILIGTESVEVSEKLSRIFKQNKLEHTVLNAKQHEREAEIIAHAGKRGAITIATNMAGRGTDIKLEQGVAGIGRALCHGNNAPSIAPYRPTAARPLRPPRRSRLFKIFCFF